MVTFLHVKLVSVVNLVLVTDKMLGRLVISVQLVVAVN
jgi:hypothetical protein